MGTNDKPRIAVICGGPSSERDISIRSASEIMKHLPAEYEVQLIEVSHEGKWLVKASREPELPTDTSDTSLPASFAGIAMTPRIKESFAVAFLATHGRFGEDGRLQALLDLVGLPYTGSGVLASALAMNKSKTRQFVKGLGIPTPRSLEVGKISKSHNALENRVLRSVGYPCVVKPNESGSSIGVSIVDHPEQLMEAVQVANKEDATVLIEEFLPGREFSCAVLGNSLDEDLVPLPPVEIIPRNRFFDFEAKYTSGGADEVCPVEREPTHVARIQDLAVQVHRALGCDGLTRSDFILGEDDEIYFIEINTIPGMTEQSLCPKEASAAGYTYGEFLQVQVHLALRRHNRV